MGYNRKGYGRESYYDMPNDEYEVEFRGRAEGNFDMFEGGYDMCCNYGYGVPVAPVAGYGYGGGYGNDFNIGESVIFGALGAGLFGGGFGGWGGNAGGGVVTGEIIGTDLISNQIGTLADMVAANNTNGEIRAVQGAISDSTLANCNSFGQVQSSVANAAYQNALGQAGIERSICAATYENAMLAKDNAMQLAECCCSLQTAIHAEGEATRDMLCDLELKSLNRMIAEKDAVINRQATVDQITHIGNAAAQDALLGAILAAVSA